MNVRDKFTADDFDPDTAPDLSTDKWPEKFEKEPVRRGRPLSENRKVSIAIQLSQDVIEYFKSGGPGWQTRIDEALRDWIKNHNAA